jgi:hypothetical protein
MTQHQAPYHTSQKTAVSTTYQLTPAEQRIIDWLRRGSSRGGDWVGTVRYVSHPGIWQMSDHVNAGQVKR